MSLFKEISDIVIKLKRNAYIETHEATFYVDEDSEEVRWNADGDLEELYDGNGSTYSAEISNSWEQDDCSFFNVDNGCGETITMVFLSNCEVDYDHLEEMFNGEEEE